MSTDRRIIAAACAETDPRRRPATVVVDWERIGKTERQAEAPSVIGAETTIKPDGSDAIAVLRHVGVENVVCRINALGGHTAREVDAAHAQGARAVILPMWRTPAELEGFVELIDDRLRVGVMIETAGALSNVAALRELPVEFAFVGLVDLAIERRTRSIFAPLVDGTLERVADDIGDVPFGFGGLTLPELGDPIPSRLLVGEMLRLGASFSFMRTSFFDDLGDKDPGDAMASIRDASDALARRTAAEVEADREALVLLVTALAKGGA